VTEVTEARVGRRISDADRAAGTAPPRAGRARHAGSRE